jgi:hypothetical protein
MNDDAAIYRLWRGFSTLTGILTIAGILSGVLIWALTPERDDPVVITSQFELLTPRVPVGGNFSFRLWRESNESCPGAGVAAFVPVDPPVNGQVLVISTRYPLATPGYRSPPPLTVTRPLPPQITPGKWRVRTGVDSNCPTRSRYDQTGDFELEVY